MLIDKHLPSRLIYFLLLALAQLPGMAQVKFSTVSNSRQLGKADYFQVEFLVENAAQIENLTPPPFRDFQVVQGPNQSTGMTVVNGSVSQYKALSFILRPLRTGTFTIPGATALVDGKPMHSNPVTIRVYPGGSSASRSQPMPMPQPGWAGEDPEFEREYILRPGEDIREKISKNIFVKVLLSKTSCYVGEPVVATYKLYSRLQSESRVTKHPSLNGFSVYDMVDPTTDHASVEQVHGKPFSVHIIRKAQLIPLQAGNISLDPVELDNTVHFIKPEERRQKRSSNPMQELFDRFSGLDEATGEHIEEHIPLESKPVEVSVKALPSENRPADFSGAVGQFTLEEQLDSRPAAAEDGAIMKITVKGTGNLPMVNAPAVNWPAGVENYAGKTREEIDKTVAPMNGLKTFEYKFVPSHAGSYVIPAVTFSYFDPGTGQYKSLSGQPQAFTVGEAVKHRSRQGRAISPVAGGSLLSGTKQYLSDHLEWILGSLILGGLALYWYHQKRQAGKAAMQARKAAEEARHREWESLASQPVAAPVDPLEPCRKLLQSGIYSGFYGELNRILWSEINEKVQVRASERNKLHIVRELENRGWNEGQTQLLENTLGECERNLYTPDHKEADLQRILSDADRIVEWLRAG